MPNVVDFSYVFSHAGFDDNITIYMLLIVTGVIYLTLLVWARWQDGLDVALVSAIVSCIYFTRVSQMKRANSSQKIEYRNDPGH